MRLPFPRLSLVWLVLITLFFIPTFLRTFDLAALGGWILALLIFGGVRALLSRLTGKTAPIWLRLEGSTLYLRTMGGSAPLIPSKVEWKDQKTFVVRTRRGRLELVFTSPEKAVEAFRFIQTTFPGVEVVHPEIQQLFPN